MPEPERPEPYTLPAGSVISLGPMLILIKDNPSRWTQWSCTNGSRWGDQTVENQIQSGKTMAVLRKGWE